MFDSNVAWDWFNRVMAIYAPFNSLVVGLFVVAVVVGILFSMMVNRGR